MVRPASPSLDGREAPGRTVPPVRARPLVLANWKMHADRAEASRAAGAIRDVVAGCTGVEVVLCPPTPWLVDLRDLLAGTAIRLGAQNVWWERPGARTGEVAAEQLVGLVDYVLVGHPERRQLFHDTDQIVRLKLRAVVDAGLQPVLVVGETRDDRAHGRSVEVVRRQLLAAADALAAEPAPLVAYEPPGGTSSDHTAVRVLSEMLHDSFRAVGPAGQGALRLLAPWSLSHGALPRAEFGGVVIGGPAARDPRKLRRATEVALAGLGRGERTPPADRASCPDSAWV
jgi:triosephosphate isomerase (TIM)